jgi:hypothetical protein
MAGDLNLDALQAMQVGRAYPMTACAPGPMAQTIQSFTATVQCGSSCNCIGPQNGASMCPCQMRAQGVYERDGRWIRPDMDLGPAAARQIESEART